MQLASARAKQNPLHLHLRLLAEPDAPEIGSHLRPAEVTPTMQPPDRATERAAVLDCARQYVALSHGSLQLIGQPPATI